MWYCFAGRRFAVCGKGNVIKMKQKKTLEGKKQCAIKTSIRKTGTMLGAVILCVFTIGAISAMSVIGDSEVISGKETTSAQTERVTEISGKIDWKKASINEYDLVDKAVKVTSAAPKTTSGTKAAEKAETTTKATTAKTTASTTAVKTTTVADYSTPAVNSGTISYTDEEFEMICYVLQNEAGGCSESSKVAVANVIINRVKSPNFPNTLKEVLTADNQFTAINNYYNKVNVPTQNTIDCAARALNGEDNSNGAVFYYAPKYCSGSSAAWFETLTFCMELEGQRFFKY